MQRSECEGQPIRRSEPVYTRAGTPQGTESFFRRHERLVISLALLALFLVGHSVLNELAARRPKAYLPVLFENHIPVLPAFIVVYLLSFALVFVPAIVVRDGPAFRRTARAFLTAILVSFAFFLILPLTVERVDAPQGAEAFARLLDWFQSGVKPHNTFPSLHVTLCSLAAISCLAHKPRVGIMMVIFAALVVLSTLFLKLHVILDVVAGLVLAGTAWFGFGRGRGAVSPGPRTRSGV